MKAPWFRVRLLDESDSAEIEIIGTIGEGWYGEESVTVSEFKKTFDSIKNRNAVKLILISPGGNLFDGVALYNLLSTIRPKLTVEVLGLAASAASVIALAGRELVMGEGAWFMIHEAAWGVFLAFLRASELREMADRLDKLNGNLADVYDRHSTLSRDEIVQKLADETWFTAEETVAAGFASRVAKHDQEETDEDEEVAAMLGFDLSMFRRVPAKLAAAIRGAAGTRTPPGAASVPANKGQEEPMDYMKLKAEVAKLTPEERTKLATELELAPKAELEAVTNRVSALEKANEQLSQQLAAERGEKTTRERTEVLDAALKEGRIPPKDRDFWAQKLEKDFAGTREILNRLQPSAHFTPVGVGAGGAETDFTAEDLEAMKHMNMGEDESRKYKAAHDKAASRS